MMLLWLRKWTCKLLDAYTKSTERPEKKNTQNKENKNAEWNEKQTNYNSVFLLK